MKPDCPNCQSNNCHHINELQTIDHIIFKVNDKEWEALNKALNETPSPSIVKRLKSLFGK